MENQDSLSRPSVNKPERIVSKIRLTPKQREAQALVQSGKRHVLLVGGARSGKTTLLINKIAGARRQLRQFASCHLCATASTR